MIRPYARALFACLLISVPVDAGAQYFGRNKVEYSDFKFRILSTEHFDVYYYAREEQAARIAALLAERWYTRISRLLGHQLDRRQPLVLYGSQAEFAQTNVVSGLLPDSVGGVTESSRRRIVMPFAPTMAETNRVLGHELVHAFQYDIGRHYGGTGQPLWFIEGMAEYLARGSLDAESSLWLRDAVINHRLPAREKNAARELSPYHYGHALWSYLGRRFGDGVVEKALKPGKKNRRLEDRMRAATGESLAALYAGWRKSVDEAYGASASAERLPRWTRGSMQLGPALSPDGTHAVFFSERDRLSLDLFLANIETGQIVRKLATTVASARFDSLQPLRSSGAWSADGRQFAFAAVRRGQATLMLLDMSGAGGGRELAFEGLGQILSPTWSPDGHAIAFSALAGGVTDLYSYDFASRRLRQLTDDAYADLQPAWSHDGRSIAFVTERFSSDLRTLQFGRPRLAVLDVETRAVRAIGIDCTGAELNPQWSPDDRELYFVGEQHGVSNVFRVGLTGPALHRLTNVPTGVGGVTPTSPALSIASRSPVAAFTVYDNGRPQLVVLDGADAIAGETVAEAAAAAEGDATAVSLPSGPIDRSLADHATGLPDASSVRGRDYLSRLSLEAVGQPYLSSGGGPFGTFVRGGGALLFGDMLGGRRLGAAVQIGNRRHDAAFELRFLNQERRWTWGAIAGLEPGVRRFRRSSAIEHEGEPALLKEVDYLQRVQVRAAGLVAYPFSRGLRVEFTGGVRHAAYRSDRRSEVSSVASGRVLASGQIDASGGRPTTVAEASAALVHDTTTFGPTGALLGSRYRFEVSPAVGDLRYTRLMADYRRYLMPVRPYSLAVRLLHSGRYGRDGNDPRLSSSFLGSTYLVRGHGRDLSYCVPAETRACGDELMGSRLLVGNLELRVPIWGLFSRQIAYGPLPADAFVFADGGLVWASPGRRHGISSVGGGIRLNAGGLPLELAAIRALDGPAPRWQFEFGFRVGF